MGHKQIEYTIGMKINFMHLWPIEKIDRDLARKLIFSNLQLIAIFLPENIQWP
jgi:hypothetical protein